MSINSPDMPPERLAFGVTEAAQVAGIGRSTLYAAMADGQLRAVKLGKRTLIPAEELRRFLGALPAAKASQDAA